MITDKKKCLQTCVKVIGFKLVQLELLSAEKYYWKQVKNWEHLLFPLWCNDKSLEGVHVTLRHIPVMHQINRISRTSAKSVQFAICYCFTCQICRKILYLKLSLNYFFQQYLTLFIVFLWYIVALGIVWYQAPHISLFSHIKFYEI